MNCFKTYYFANDAEKVFDTDLFPELFTRFLHEVLSSSCSVFSVFPEQFCLMEFLIIYSIVLKLHLFSALQYTKINRLAYITVISESSGVR